jgi:hypothetical protein
VIVVAALLIILAIIRTQSNTTTDPVGDALDVIDQSVELFAIEHDKVVKGTPAAQTGAPGAIDRALNAFKAVEADLRKLHPAATDALGKDLAALRAALNAPDTKVGDVVADASAQVGAIRLARLSTPGR